MSVSFGARVSIGRERPRAGRTWRLIKPLAPQRMAGERDRETEGDYDRERERELFLGTADDIEFISPSRSQDE